MEREELRIEISADAKQAIREIAGATGAFTNLANTGKTSVAVLNDALAELRKERNNTFDANKISQFNKAIRELEFSAKGLKDIGIRSDVGENARRARVAIYGLNQVVRDLPFGFIAISNNIPVLLDQFQALVREQKSVSAAFKEFGKGLIGGAGISLALSAIISLITTLSVKYGGLGNALREISGNVDFAALAAERLQKAVDEGSGSITAEVTKLRQLNDILKDASKSAAEHATASRAINEELEKSIPSLTGATTATRALTDAQLDYAERVLQAQVIMAAMSESIKDVQKRYNEAKHSGTGFMDWLQGATNKFGVTTAPFALIGLLGDKSLDQAAQEAAKDRIQTFADAVQQAIADSNEKLKELQDSGIATEDIFGIKRLKEHIDKLKEVFDEALKAEINYLKARIDAASQFGVERIQLERQLALKEKQLADNEAARTIQSKEALHTQLLANELNYRTKLAKLAAIPIAELDFSEGGRRAAERFSASFIEGLKKNPITLEKIGVDPNLFDKIKVPDWIDKFNKKVQESARQAAEAYKEMAKEVAESIQFLGGIFDDLTAGVLEDFLTKGKEGFETLIQNVGKLAIKLAEAAIKAAAINLALKALGLASPGFGALFKGAIGLGTGGTKVAMPGISAGALVTTPSLSTRVSGSDLLVILNRSLRTEGRIG